MTATSEATGGRANQKTRTRRAIIDACRELVRTGADVTMPEVARRALVSEATAYRYFPDLTSLLAETIDGLWPSPDEALAPVASSADPVERVRFACEFLLRGVLSYQGAVRAMISGTITRPGLGAGPPGDPVRADRRRARPVRRRPRSGAAQARPGRGGQRRGPLHPHRPVRAEPGRGGRQRGADRGHPDRRGLPRLAGANPARLRSSGRPLRCPSRRSRSPSR